MMKTPHTFPPKKINASQGFSLLEFLVASFLSMIVLIAVTSTYFTARTLNTSASSRLNVQQDLRNAANLLTRDARMAGSFGCFNMPAYQDNAVLADISENQPGLQLVTPGQTQLSPVKTFEASAFNTDSFTADSDDAIVFQYGIDAGNLANIPTNVQTVFSTCSSVTRPTETLGSTDEVRTALNLTDNSQDANVSVMRYVANAYAIGTSGEKQGLFRFQLNDDGTWSNPQLLVSGITAWNIDRIHVTPDSCPQAGGANALAIETFDYNNATLENTTPALIRLSLNHDTGTVEAEEDNTVTVYHIDATVRGGNTCADRSI